MGVLGDFEAVVVETTGHGACNVSSMGKSRGRFLRGRKSGTISSARCLCGFRRDHVVAQQPVALDLKAEQVGAWRGSVKRRTDAVPGCLAVLLAAKGSFPATVRATLSPLSDASLVRQAPVTAAGYGTSRQ